VMVASSVVIATSFVLTHRTHLRSEAVCDRRIPWEIVAPWRHESWDVQVSDLR